MKKLFLLPIMLATVLTGCLIDNGDAEPADGSDSVAMTQLNIRLSGISAISGVSPSIPSTRAMEGEGQITANTNKLANVHVFILNAAGTNVTDYAKVELSNDLTAMMSTGWIFPDPIPANSQVFILGNVPSDYDKTVREIEGQTINQILDFTSDIWTQADYDYAAMANLNGSPVGLTVNPITNSASVSIQVAPVISRIELHSLEAAGQVNGFTVTGIFLTDFRTAFTYGGGFPAASMPIDNTISLETNGGMTGDEANVVAQGSPLVAEMSGNRIWAYNVVAGTRPLIVVRMRNVMVGARLHPGPLYLTVSSYGPVAAFAPGHIYRIPTLTFTEEHLTLAPSADGIGVSPIEWIDVPPVGPNVNLPMAINILPVGAFNAFPASGWSTQTFSINAGSKTINSWSATISDPTNFSLTVPPAPGTTFDIVPNADNLTFAPRTATVTVTAEVEDGYTRTVHNISRKITVTQQGGVPPALISMNPALPAGLTPSMNDAYILYFAPDPSDPTNPDSNRLLLSEWDDALDKTNYRTNMAFFKFGSVIGLSHSGKNNGDAFDLTDIKFNPSTLTIGQGGPSDIDSYNGALGATIPTNEAEATTANSLPAIPGYLPAHFTQVPSITNISTTTGADAYHTHTNLLDGRGDPCQLVGLTAGEIRAALAAGEGAFNTLIANRDAAHPEYANWRLPTNTENQTFIGNSVGDGTQRDISTNQYNFIENGAHDDDPGLGQIEARGQVFLPVVSVITYTGQVTYKGGIYHSSTAIHPLTKYNFYVDAVIVHPSGTSGTSQSEIARCVRQ